MKTVYRSSASGKFVTAKSDRTSANSVVKVVSTPAGVFRTIDEGVVKRAKRAANVILSGKTFGGSTMRGELTIIGLDGGVKKR